MPSPGSRSATSTTPRRTWRAGTRATLADLPGGEHLWRDEYHAPKILRSALPTDVVWKRAQALLRGKQSPPVDFRVERDAERHLCGFVYYAGLVERWRRHQDRNVLFMHTKGETDDDAVAEGVEVATAVIRAAVETIEHQSKSAHEACLELCGKCVGM